MEGWQWLFLLEGIPAVLLGLVVLLILPNSPYKANWLSETERKWIKIQIEEEKTFHKGKTSSRLLEALTSGRVWFLCLIYFLLNVGGYGYEMWMPSIIKEFSGLDYTIVGLINAIPYIAASVVMLLVGRHSDQTGERRWHVAIAAVTSAIGFVLTAYFQNPYLAMLALILAFVGLKSTVGPFWALGTASLSGTAAAGGIAFINSVGNLGGFVGPTLVGVFKDQTDNNVIALLILGGALLLMGILVLILHDSPQKK